MSHEKLVIGVSVFTTISFFSSIAGIGKCSAQIPLHLPDSHKSAVKSKYKSPLYKLWQYAAKNKPSLYNSDVIHSSGKKHSQLQRFFTTYQYFSEKFIQLENCIKQSISETSRKWFLCENIFSFHKCNNDNINLYNILCFILRIYLVHQILAYVRNIFKKARSIIAKDVLN